MLTQHDREEWWRHPMTQEFLRQIVSTREETKERWATQAFFDPEDSEKSARLNAYALAGIDVLGQVIDLVEENRPQPTKSED